MEYSNAELTQRVKQLENIVMDLMGQQVRSRGVGYIHGICVNTSLHSHNTYDSPEDAKEHPADLLVPHYAWEPQIDWGCDMIQLHPLNKPRA